MLLPMALGWLLRSAAAKHIIFNDRPAFLKQFRLNAYHEAMHERLGHFPMGDDLDELVVQVRVDEILDWGRGVLGLEPSASATDILKALYGKAAETPAFLSP